MNYSRNFLQFRRIFTSLYPIFYLKWKESFYSKINLGSLYSYSNAFELVRIFEMHKIRNDICLYYLRHLRVNIWEGLIIVGVAIMKKNFLLSNIGYHVTFKVGKWQKCPNSKKSSRGKHSNKKFAKSFPQWIKTFQK